VNPEMLTFLVITYVKRFLLSLDKLPLSITNAFSNMPFGKN